MQCWRRANEQAARPPRKPRARCAVCRPVLPDRRPRQSLEHAMNRPIIGSQCPDWPAQVRRTLRDGFLVDGAKGSDCETWPDFVRELAHALILLAAFGL